jgi:hypothetical protein
MRTKTKKKILYNAYHKLAHRKIKQWRKRIDIERSFYKFPEDDLC